MFVDRKEELEFLQKEYEKAAPSFIVIYGYSQKGSSRDGEKSREEQKRLYFIKDYFLDFWFKFVYPNLSFLEIGEKEYVMSIVKRDFEEKHVNFVYEDLCREKVGELNAEAFFPMRFERIGRWWDGRDEIDVVGIANGNSFSFLNPKKDSF